MLRDYPLIVFDWDGTLMDSAAQIVTSMQRAAMDQAVPVPDDETVREVIGLGLGEAMARVFPGVVGQDLERLVAGYRDHYLHEANQTSRLFEGAEEVIERLTEGGHLLGIATGKSRKGLERALAETGLKQRFAVTRCADEAASKPHPQMLEEIMTDLDMEPARTLMIGDTEYDLEMARSAGTAAVAAGYGVHSPQRLAGFNPLVVLDDIRELLRYL